MSSNAGVFNDRARAAIYEAAGQRCIGCGRSDLTCQHRRARGMGGTDNIAIGHPANGVALCGSGNTGCHGWAEINRADSTLLGWTLDHSTPALGSPFWQRGWGWRAWIDDPDDPKFVGVIYVDRDEDLDRPEEREAALARYRLARPIPASNSGLKSQR